MFTDMVGYTVLGQKNESLSLALLDEQRKLIRPILGRYKGREVKTIGDAFFVEFSSALDAVRCAYDIQRSVRELNISHSDDNKIKLRVGIHLGDVIEREGDVSGDAVNVASRIEAHSAEGGVCLSQQVYDQVANKFELPLMPLGVKELKNVAMPLQLYSMVMPWDDEVSERQRVLDPRRVAVLPFANMSPDPGDEYFADGMTEELISTMSRINGLRVIARTSVMGYKDVHKKISEVAKELEVGSILEGSVRKAENRLRITVQLIESRTGDHLWAESYDRELKDVFAIQSDISKTVSEALKVKLLSNTREQLEKVPTTSTEAYTFYLKGRHFLSERTQQGFVKAMGYFEEAIRRDQDYSLAYSGLADCYHLMDNWGFMEPESAWQKSKEFASKAVQKDDSLAESHVSMAMALAIMDWNWEAAEDEYKRAIELNPNYVTAHHWYAVHLLVAKGRWDDAIREMKEAFKLDPFSAVVATNLGRVLFASGRQEEGLKQFRLALEIDPGFAYAHLHLGEALVSRASIEEGIRELEAANSLSSNYFAAMAGLAYGKVASGRTGDAELILQTLLETSRSRYVPSTWTASVHAVLGQLDQAFELLSKVVLEHSSTLPEFYSDPIFDAMRKDPRSAQLLRGMGL